MSKEMEIEFKNLLNKDEYDNLLAEYQLSESSLKTQTNIYFDTPDFKLKAKKMGLRIRLSNSTTEFTLKTPTSNQHTLLEVTDYLSSFTSELSLVEQVALETSEVAEYLIHEGIQLSSLQSIGKLTTTRGEVSLQSNVLLVLDKSLYYGKTDYELEMEVADAKEGALIFKDILKKHHIPVRQADKKIARMLAYKQQTEA
ncbi:CYTH domain-containing protein [Vagococcus carniphilus]|uniref:CYTH domain-containing protein n=1 Tax=Vagococcus carniphilus TaxID=218144 RepID=UPI00288CE8D5|nr:CYTH domain-containing protein [Vagococcus carniphilus]MDT2829932.1 CYTH domain-containing protein [Vagococcus carniphilus]MDT2838366.1 CYTH domain-containing protein [Vagococcus carniphilus]MDT2854362.1 CYTH domain-containing protein [Vagococcus carniphilus]